MRLLELRLLRAVQVELKSMATDIMDINLNKHVICSAVRCKYHNVHIVRTSSSPQARAQAIRLDHQEVYCEINATKFIHAAEPVLLSLLQKRQAKCAKISSRQNSMQGLPMSHIYFDACGPFDAMTGRFRTGRPQWCALPNVSRLVFHPSHFIDRCRQKHSATCANRLSPPLLPRSSPSTQSTHMPMVRPLSPEGSKVGCVPGNRCTQAQADAELAATCDASTASAWLHLAQQPQGKAGATFTIAGFYHVGLVGHWREIVIDQLQTLKTCGLLSVTGVLVVSYHERAGQANTSQVAVLAEMIGGLTSGMDIELQLVQSAASVAPYEGTIVERVLGYCQQQRKGFGRKALVFYLHNKGSSKVKIEWLDSYAPVLYWRKYMEYFLFEHPEWCIAALTNSNATFSSPLPSTVANALTHIPHSGALTCGVNIQNASQVLGGALHYSGNFWFARCDYVRTLQSLKRTRMRANPGFGRSVRSISAELWIGQGIRKLANGMVGSGNADTPASPHISLHQPASASLYKYLLRRTEYATLTQKWRYTAVTVAKPQPVPKYLASGTEIVRKPPRSSSYTRGPAAELPHPADKAQTTSVFYHIYADPSLLSSVDQQARVVAQQLKVVKASPLASSPLVFVTIGSPAMASRAISVAHAFYPHGGFKHLGHHAVGWEDKTLQALYEHCAANPSKSVVYLHNKGSHHPSKTNSRLRAALTRAVLSAECAIYPPHRRVGIQACDICGFRFRGDPMPNLQGNMWSADCKHIASLIAPAAFGGALAAMHNVVDHNMTLKQWFKPARSDVSWQADRASWTGLDRTAYEYWVASHPNTKPCDVWGDTELEAGRRGGGYMLPTNRSWLLERRTFAGRETVSDLRHPWFALQGRLYQWQVLYGQAPEAKSWAWKFWAYSHYKKGRWVSV